MLDPHPNHTLLQSFGWALRGIGEALVTERNMRIHYAAASVAGVGAVALDLEALEILLVLAAIALVLATELVNTAVEAAVDLATSNTHPLARLAKDAAAGAVLIGALFSLGVAAWIFLPKLAPLQLREGALGWAAALALACLGGGGWIYLVRRKRRTARQDAAVSALE